MLGVVLSTAPDVVVSGICVVVLGASIGEYTSISCSPPLAHNTEHDSRHACKSVASDIEASHIVKHNAAHCAGAAPVVGMAAVAGAAALEVVAVGLFVVVCGVSIGAAVVV